MIRKLFRILPLLLVGGCARMGDRPPWWKAEPPEPVDPALVRPAKAPAPPSKSHRSPKDLDNDPEYIQRRVRERYAEIRACYEQTLARDELATGRVSYAFTIEPSGEVGNACVDSYTLADGTLLECTVKIFKSLRFRANDDGKTTVVYPIVFEVAKDTELWLGK
jgi:hypothetical protein